MDSLRISLAANAQRLGLELDDATWGRLDTLAGLWIRYGRSMNLTGARTPAELASHITEALQVVTLARGLGLDRRDVRWLDVGSGAGFPGLVVAACLPVDLTLVEPRERRAGFLEVALAALRASGRVLRGQVGAGSWASVGKASSLEGGFDVTDARAVFAPEAWVEVGGSWTRPGGFVFAHCSVDSSAFRADKMVRECNFDRWSVRAYRVDG